MKIDIYALNGTKKGTQELPASLFEGPINEGLMHQVLIMQQANRRNAIAHVKRRSEVAGSTRKVYQQKHTGRARRGPVRSPLLRGGGKAFGPRSDQNFSKDMPRTMRRVALISCLSEQAKRGAILGLESNPIGGKTKDIAAMLKNMPVELGRRILIVAAERNENLMLSTRNIPRVRAITAAYLNPEDVLGAHRIIFVVDAIAAAESIFARKNERMERSAKEIAEASPPEKNKRITKNKKNAVALKAKKSSSST